MIKLSLGPCKGPVRASIRGELKKALLLFFVAALSLGSLLVFAASKTHAKTREATSGRNVASINTNGYREAEPCKEGLKLTVEYQAAQSYSGAGEMKLKFQVAKNGAAVAENVLRAQKKDVSQALCQVWQKHAWPHVDRMIAQSALKSRGSFECINVAHIQYEIGGKKKSSKICIGSARQDTMSNAFYQFLEQTAYLTKQN